MTSQTQTSIDAMRAMVDALCSDLPGQLLEIPFFGPLISAIASIVCTVANAVLGLPNDVLTSLSA